MRRQKGKSYKMKRNLKPEGKAYRSAILRNAFLFLLLLAVCCINPHSRSAASEDGGQRDVIRVGFFAMDGYHMIDEQGNRSGYGYDFLQLAARYLDVDFAYVGYEKSWDEMQAMLENGDIDLLTSARKTPEREKKFDFSRPIGNSSAILTIRSDNSSIIMHDFDTYNDMHVALLNGNTRNEDFASFAQENNFTYFPVYFDTTDEMTQALQDGTVDAVVTSSLRQTKNERIIEKFKSSDFYAIVRKGNTGLLDKINYAIDQMNATEGDWRTELHNKYYENYDDRNLTFTEEELEIIQKYSSKSNALTVVCDPTRYPYSYVENGEVVGILPDYFRRLADYAGLAYRFIVCDSRDEYLNYRNSQEADLCIDVRLDSQGGEELSNGVATAPYLTLRTAMVTRTDFGGEIQTVATVAQSGAYDVSGIRNAEKLVFDTREDAMQAVLDGKADAALVYYYIAQAFVSREKSGALTYRLLDDTSYKYHIVVSEQVNHALAGILTKAIYAMPGSLIEDISTAYTAYRAKDLTFIMLMQMHPLTSLCVGVLLAAMIVVFLIGRIHVQKRNAKEAQQRAVEMEVLAEKADAANKAKSRFLSNMSHDIRTPLNGIVGLLKINEKNFDNTSLIRENHRKMMVSADYLLSLINDILQMSKLENGEYVLEHDQINLYDIEQDIRTIVTDEAREAGITWKCEKEVFPHPDVYGSPLHLKEIFLNIYSNCIKYNRPDGTITTTLEMTEEREGFCKYRWTISDTGIGMSREFLQHIFEPFVQEKHDARSVYQGTGLGMSLVKNLVERMNGTIEVSSEKGVGSTFVVTIPFETAAPANQSGPETGKTEASISGMKLLMAEDNELNAEVAQALLESEGAEVTVVRNGQQAVEQFCENAEGTFDAILMDLMMPVMDGLTATGKIRAMDREDAGTIPIIAITANAFAEDESRCLEAGMNAHLAKPLDMEKVKVVLSEQVKRG